MTTVDQSTGTVVCTTVNEVVVVDGAAGAVEPRGIIERAARITSTTTTATKARLAHLDRPSSTVGLLAPR